MHQAWALHAHWELVAAHAGCMSQLEAHHVRLVLWVHDAWMTSSRLTPELCFTAEMQELQDKKGADARARLKRFFSSLYACLARGARAVLQIYPENAEQVVLTIAVPCWGPAASRLALKLSVAYCLAPTAASLVQCSCPAETGVDSHAEGPTSVAHYAGVQATPGMCLGGHLCYPH